MNCPLDPATNATVPVAAGRLITGSVPEVIVVEETVCEVETVYVPVPPVPVPRAVIVVPEVTPVPVMRCPTAIVPLVTALTVSVVVLIEPVKTA